MQFQFDVSNTSPPLEAPAPVAPPVPQESTRELLKQLLEVQREHLEQTRAQAALHDQMHRWRALAARWQEDFPQLPKMCKAVLPTLEKAYGQMLHNLVQELEDAGPDVLDSDFTLQDFLDRFSMRLGQLGHLLGIVGPLSEAGSVKAPEE